MADIREWAGTGVNSNRETMHFAFANSPNFVNCAPKDPFALRVRFHQFKPLRRRFLSRKTPDELVKTVQLFLLAFASVNLLEWCIAVQTPTKVAEWPSGGWRDFGRQRATSEPSLLPHSLIRHARKVAE